MGGGVVKAVSTRTIQAGEEITVQYPCAGVDPCFCLTCGKAIQQRRERSS